MCEVALDTVSSHFAPKWSRADALTRRDVVSTVVGVVGPLCTSANWLERRTAAVLLFILVESCVDAIAPMAGELGVALRPLLHDACVAVSRAAAFFFSELCEYLEETALEECPWLIGDLNNVGVASRFEHR